MHLFVKTLVTRDLIKSVIKEDSTIPFQLESCLKQVFLGLALTKAWQEANMVVMRVRESVP